jgi:hypothetical protein
MSVYSRLDDTHTPRPGRIAPPDWGTKVNTMMALWPRPSVHCARTVDQTGIVTNTITDVTWTVETFDTHGFISVPSATFTIPTGLDGVYFISFALDWDNTLGTGTDPGRRLLLIEENGVLLSRTESEATSTGRCAQGITCLHWFDAGTTIKGQVYHTATSNRTIEFADSDITFNPRFRMVWMGR